MSDIASASILEQLQLLKLQTKLTGGLHEAQVVNLRAWPLVLFPPALSVAFTWDPDKRLVSYELTTAPGKQGEPKKAWWQKRVDVLADWVHQLLGDEWQVEVDTGTGLHLKGPRVISNGRRTDPKPKSQSRPKRAKPRAARGKTH